MLLDVRELKDVVLIGRLRALFERDWMRFIQRHEADTSSSGSAASFDGPGNQHAARRFGPTSASGGGSEHFSCRREQRGANRQPLGGFRRSGGSPPIGTSFSLTESPSVGIDDRRPIVYGCCGAENRSN